MSWKFWKKKKSKSVLTSQSGGQIKTRYLSTHAVKNLDQAYLPWWDRDYAIAIWIDEVNSYLYPENSSLTTISRTPVSHESSKLSY